LIERIKLKSKVLATQHKLQTGGVIDSRRNDKNSGSLRQRRYTLQSAKKKERRNDGFVRDTGVGCLDEGATDEEGRTDACL